MKINWGTGIVLAFIAFISFIVFMVVLMSTDDSANHDLVTEEYYQAELDYQKEIDAENNATKNSLNLKLTNIDEGILIVFPNGLEHKNVEGQVSLYRPSNKHFDFDLPINLSNSNLLIPDKLLLDGRWDIKVFWKYDNEQYLHKESLTY